MYYVLSENIKRRVIGELRAFWSKDPKYKDSLTPNIQGKYSFKGYPQQAIILKSSSASPMRFSADNYQGLVESYVHLTKAFGKQGTSIEWVVEDARKIQMNNGLFPSAAGIYYIEVVEEDYAWNGVVGKYLVFYVDPLLAVRDDSPIMVDPRTYDVSAGKFHEGSLVLYEMPGNLPLYEGVNYSADPSTGRITLVRPLSPGTSLSADYYYAGTSSGPFPVEENGANNDAIPGVVLAFGRRAFAGDIMAVVVTERREPNSREFGGKFEISVDLEVMARDVNAQGEIADRTFMYLQAELRDRLSFEGIEIDSVSFGGDAEEVYEDNSQDYSYTGSISMTLLTDWSVQVPLGAHINRILPGSTLYEDQVASALDDDQLAANGFAGGIKYTDQLGLQFIQDPWYRDRTKNYEKIR